MKIIATRAPKSAIRSRWCGTPSSTAQRRTANQMKTTTAELARQASSKEPQNIAACSNTSLLFRKVPGTGIGSNCFRPLALVSKVATKFREKAHREDPTRYLGRSSGTLNLSHTGFLSDIAIHGAHTVYNLHLRCFNFYGCCRPQDLYR